MYLFSWMPQIPWATAWVKLQQGHTKLLPSNLSSKHFVQAVWVQGNNLGSLSPFSWKRFEQPGHFVISSGTKAIFVWTSLLLHWRTFPRFEREHDYIAFDEYYNEPIGRSFGNCDIYNTTITWLRKHDHMARYFPIFLVFGAKFQYFDNGE